MKFYKLGYFFLSKVNNITESLEKGLDKVVSRGEKNFSVHRKYMNFLRPRKTALDEPLYKLSAGRSMVEMLGVLAIIGVLSVGAIAGYSKAMTKYKLNKQAEAFNMLLANAIQISKQIPKATTTNAEGHNDLLEKINLLPDGIRYDETTNRLFDNFGNKIAFYSRAGFGYEWAMGFSLENSPASFEQCQNLINIAKAFSAELLNVLREDNGSAEYSGKYLRGDNTCTEGQTCLKNLTLDNIANICSQNKNNDNTKYSFSFLW